MGKEKADAYEKHKEIMNSKEFKDWYKKRDWPDDDVSAAASVYERAEKAKKTGKYDMEFLERGLDVDDRTGELLKGKALDDAYMKYLQGQKK